MIYPMLIRCIRRYGGKVNTNTWAFQVFIAAIVKIEVDTRYVALIFERLWYIGHKPGPAEQTASRTGAPKKHL